MPVRAVMLTASFEGPRVSLLEALKDWGEIEVRALRSDADCAARLLSAGVPRRAEGGASAPRRWLPALSELLARLPFGGAVQLAVYRPDLVISEGFGTKALQAALYRSLSRRSRLLLCAGEPPPRRFGLLERIVLSRADGILAEGAAVARALEQLSFPQSQIFSASVPHDVESFLSCPRARSGAEAYRLVYVGDLSPRSGAADFLICLAAWAERNPDRLAEIWWIGEGDLAGVLEAQPLPDNVSQRFLGRLDLRGMAATFAQCGLLAVPSLGNERASPILEALAAGLPVLGSRRNCKVRQFVQEDVTGWTFDPLRPEDVAQALDRAFSGSAADLDRMRDRGRSLVRPMTTQGFVERLRQAIVAILSDDGALAVPGAAALEDA